MWSGWIVFEGSCRPDSFAFRWRGPFAVIEIFSEQSEFPELIGDVLADVRNRSVRPDDDFVLNIFFVVWLGVRCGVCASYFFFPGHDPAAGHFSGSGQLNDAG